MLVASNRNLTADRFYQALVEPRRDRYVIDLRRTNYIGAYGVVGLACAAASAKREGKKVVVKRPRRNRTRHHLSRMLFPQVLNDRLGIETYGFPSPRIGKAHGKTLVELHRFDATTGYDQVANLLWKRLDGKVRGEVINTLYDALVELCANVIEHSDVEGGFAAAQVWQSGKSDETLSLAIADYGIGIPQSLRASHSSQNDNDAIRLAVQEGVSGTSDRGRGVGLSIVAEQAMSLEGRLVIHSAGGWLRLPSTIRPAQVRPWKGTIDRGKSALPSNLKRRSAMTPTSIKTPELVTSREQARQILASLPDSLFDHEVIIDCQALTASPPSFVDEVIKVVLADKKASRLRFLHASQRLAEYAKGSASRRDLSDKLVVELRLDKS